MACSQTVKVTYDKDNKPTQWELLCSGECNDKTQCKPKVEVTDAKTGSTREYCACKGGTGAEPVDCHIVLYKVRKRPKGPIEDHYFMCEFNPANPCPPKKTCVAVPAGNHFFDNDAEKGLEWMEFRCECRPEDEVWRGK